MMYCCRYNVWLVLVLGLAWSIALHPLYAQAQDNLALDKFSWQPRPYDPNTQGPQRAVDGDVTTKTTVTSSLSTGEAQGQGQASWTVDLGAYYQVYEVRIINYEGFEVSDVSYRTHNATSYQSDYTHCGTGELSTSPEEGEAVVVSCGGVSLGGPPARYLTLLITTPEVATFGEVVVLGTTPEPHINVALNKEVFSSPGVQADTSSRLQLAVDGLTHVSPASSCSLVQLAEDGADAAASLTVDLSEAYDIESVILIHSRAEQGVDDYLYKTSVFMSNDREVLASQLCAVVPSSVTDIPTQSYDLHCQQPATGRYVTVMRDADSPYKQMLDICEILVIRAPVGTPTPPTPRPTRGTSQQPDTGRVVAPALNPTYGPVGGGTLLSFTCALSLQNIAILPEQQLRLVQANDTDGRHGVVLCNHTAVDRIDSVSCVCWTQKHEESGWFINQSLSVVITDVAGVALRDLTPYHYMYKPNPVVNNVRIYSPVGGGTKVTVTGRHLDSVQKPEMVTTFSDGTQRVTGCKHEGTRRTIMACLSAPCPYPDDITQCNVTSVRFLFDGVTEVIGASDIRLRVEYLRNPRFDEFEDDPMVHRRWWPVQSEYRMEITGASIRTNTPTDEQYVIKIGSHEVRNIRDIQQPITVYQQSLQFVVPDEKDFREKDTEYRVSVYLGNVHAYIGNLRYEHTIIDCLYCTAILFSCVGVFVLIMVVCCCYIRSKHRREERRKHSRAPFFKDEVEENDKMDTIEKEKRQPRYSQRQHPRKGKYPKREKSPEDSEVSSIEESLATAARNSYLTVVPDEVSTRDSRALGDDDPDTHDYVNSSAAADGGDSSVSGGTSQQDRPGTLQSSQGRHSQADDGSTSYTGKDERSNAGSNTSLMATRGTAPPPHEQQSVTGSGEDMADIFPIGEEQDQTYLY